MSEKGQKSRRKRGRADCKKTDPKIDDRISVIIQSHKVLESTLPISHGSILRSLCDSGVISATYLRAIRIEPLSRDKVKFLLDNVILRDLRNGNTESFDKLTEVLEGSNDLVAQKLGKGLRERKINDKQLPQTKVCLSYSAKTAREAINNMRLELIDGIPINLLISSLNLDDQKLLDKTASDEDKTSYLLDKIVKQLQVDKIQLFEELLHAMIECHDLICKSLALQLQVECGMERVSSLEATVSPGKIVLNFC